MRKNISVINPLVTVGLQLLLAVPLGLAFAKFTTGGIAWIFGGIASGALVLNAYRIFYKYSLKPNRKARQIGQALVGLAIGCSIANSNLAAVSSKLPVFVLLTLFILLTGTVIGYIYSQISGTNILNAMLATVPGGVGVMSSIAADYNRNVSLVALVQVIRVTAVILVIPILARLYASNVANANSAIYQRWWEIDFSHLHLVSLALLSAFLGFYIASILKIPAAAFFGPLTIAVIFNYLFLTELEFKLPNLINLIGQILLGITIGEHWGNKPNLGKKTVTYALIPVGMTIVAGLLAAAIAMLLTPWDWLTCLLVTAPGGSTEMILVALGLNHHVEIVTVGHLVRLMAINISLPLWVWLFRYLDEKVPNVDNS